MPPRLAIASLLEHTTLLDLKTTLTTVSSAIAASNTVASLARKWLSSTMISTTVVRRVSSSQGCLFLDLLLKRPACHLWCDFKNHDFTTRLPC